jgi:hypothetical protein
MRAEDDRTDVRKPAIPHLAAPHLVAPWIAAEELQPTQRPQSAAPLDELDEALMESFPCSDPPPFSHAHA